MGTFCCSLVRKTLNNSGYLKKNSKKLWIEKKKRLMTIVLHAELSFSVPSLPPLVFFFVFVVKWPSCSITRLLSTRRKVCVGISFELQWTWMFWQKMRCVYLPRFVVWGRAWLDFPEELLKVNFGENLCMVLTYLELSSAKTLPFFGVLSFWTMPSKFECVAFW